MTPIQKAKEIAEEKYPYPELNPEINNTLVRFRIYALREGYAAALLSGDGQEGKGLPEVVEPYVGDDKELVIKKVLQECGRILLTTYMMFQLKEFMEVMVVNDADKAEYVLSFRRFDSHLKRFPALPVADGEGEKVGEWPEFLVVKDSDNHYFIWPKNRYNKYVAEALDVGGCPAVKIVTGFNGDEDFLFPTKPSPTSAGIGENGLEDWADEFYKRLVILFNDYNNTWEEGEVKKIRNMLVEYNRFRLTIIHYNAPDNYEDAMQPTLPPSTLLQTANDKRDLLFAVLNSYDRRHILRAAALAFIKAYDELLEVAP